MLCSLSLAQADLAADAPLLAQQVPVEEEQPPPPVEAPDLLPEPAVPEPVEDLAGERALTPVPADRVAADERANDDDEKGRKKRLRRGLPALEVRALGTATAPVDSIRLGVGEFMVGVRGEVDVQRVGGVFSYDRVGDTPRFEATLRETDYWNGLVSYSPRMTAFSRVRLMAGASAVSGAGADASFGPTVGTTVHLGIPILALELAGLYTPLGFRQLDGRAEGVMRLAFFELRAGYRARWIDTSTAPDAPPVEPVGGPTASFGLVF